MRITAVSDTMVQLPQKQREDGEEEDNEFPKKLKYI